MARTHYNFNYWVCERCAHTWATTADEETPERCEYCRAGDLAGFVTLDEAEQLSQDILDETSSA